MHQLNANLNDLLSIRPTIKEKQMLATVHSTFIAHGTSKKKLYWHSISTEKKMYSRFRLQYYYDAYDLKKSISLDHHRKKYISVSDFSAAMVHRARKFLIGTQHH